MLLIDGLPGPARRAGHLVVSAIQRLSWILEPRPSMLRAIQKTGIGAEDRAGPDDLVGGAARPAG